MRTSFPTVLLIAALLPLRADADSLSGTWRYEKGADYDNQIKITAPKARVLQIVGGKAAISRTCVVAVKKARYLYSTPFQMLLKEGVEEPALDKYLGQKFAFPLTGNKDFYEADIDEECNAPLREFLVRGDKMLAPIAGSAFYSYVRSDGGTSKPVDPKIPLGGRKLSQLPFNLTTYVMLCESKIPQVKGVPKATDKCAPLYYPYVADAKDSDPLEKLIGMHDYKKGGANDIGDYSPPFASKLHPVFMLLPPLKDVLVVRVEDLEGGDEQRDTMPGAYLVVKDGKVTDQLNEGCTIDEGYACIDEDGKKRYQLLDSGKFRKL